MRYVRTLSEKEQKQLDRMSQQEVGRVALRAHMILLSARGFSVPQIRLIHQTSDVTLYHWLDRFETEGPEGLYDRPRRGRPAKVDEEVEHELKQVVSEPPSENGYNFTCWTVPLLGEHLNQRLGKRLCAETVCNALQALGFNWRRPRWAAAEDDPEASARMTTISQAILSADDETVLLVEDETIFKCLPPLRSMWMPCGEQVRVETPKQNDDICLYGSLNLTSGETITHFFEKANSEHTISHLEKLLNHYPHQELLLIWDQASFHSSRKVQQFINQHERLTVLPLPKAAPQENPLENLWRILKDRVAANLTRTLAAIKDACKTFFSETSPATLLQMAGLPSFS